MGLRRATIPAAVMGAFFGKVVYPAYHWLKMDGVNNARRHLERSQWLPTEDVLAIQQEKLARLLLFARENVPYYRTLLKDLEVRKGRVISPDSFRRIPKLTKNIIRSEVNELASENMNGNGLLPNSTSGSTGEATRFSTDFRSMAWRAAAEIRSDAWTGWSLGEKYARLWGSPLDLKQDVRLSVKLRGLLGGGGLILSSFELSASKMDEYVDKIRRFKPTLFVVYPGPLEQFAMHCRARSAVFPSLKGIVSSAEMLWPHQRQLAEEVFHVKVFDRYGCREVGLIGSECEAHNGLHVSVDRLLVEVVSDDGQPCLPGEIGNILVTDLDNFGMPMIRYDIGDRGIFAENSDCGCGRGLPLMEKIEGRTLDMIHTRNGRSVGGTFWTFLLKSHPGIRRFQVVQRSLDGITIHFVRDDDFDQAVLPLFEEKIHEHCGRDFDVKFIETDTIDLTSSGKQRLVVSSIPSHDHSVGA